MDLTDDGTARGARYGAPGMRAGLTRWGPTDLTDWLLGRWNAELTEDGLAHAACPIGTPNMADPPGCFTETIKGYIHTA